MAIQPGLTTIPRELRDHIYSYLVHPNASECLQDELSEAATKRRYHFGITGVSRQLHDEAIEYFQKHNTFVLVTYQWLDFDGATGPLNAYRLPVVTRDYAAAKNFASHSLHLDLVVSQDSPWNFSAAQRPQKARVDDAAPGAFVIELQDFQLFVHAIQRRIMAIPSPAVYISAGTSAGDRVRIPRLPRRNHAKSKQVSTTATIRDAPFKPVTPQLADSFVSRIQKLVSPSQTVVLQTESATAGWPLRLSSCMMPSVVSLAPFLWDVLHNARNVKAVVDNLLADGAVETARVHYRGFQDLATADLTLMFDFVSEQHSPTLNYFLQFTTLLADCALTAGFLGMRQLGMKECWWFDLAMDILMICGQLQRRTGSKLVYNGDGGSIAITAYKHADVLRSSLIPTLEASSLQDLDDIADKLYDLSEDSPEDKYIAHDLALVERMLDDPAQLSRGTAEQRIRRLSVWALPPRALTTPLPLNAAPAPQGYDGWEASDLTADEKRAVHLLQEEHGLPLTTFT